MRGAIATTAAAIGTLMKNTQRQLSACTITPPSSSPTAPPAPAIAPQTESARLRSLPSAKVVRISESAAGETIAPPRPWSPRATRSVPSDREIPHSSDAAANRAMPIMNRRRRPSVSARRPPRRRKPPKISVYAFSTHDRLCSENPTLRWIVGSATFTTVASSTTMNCAAATSTRRVLGSTRGAGRAAGMASAADITTVRSCRQQAVGEHDLDHRGNRLDARPVALQLAGERDPADRLRAGLDDPLEPGAMGLERRAADRVDDGIDLVALAKGVEGGERHADLGPERAEDELPAARRANGLHELAVLPGVDGRAVERRAVPQ